MRARTRFFSATPTPSFVPAVTGQRSYTKVNVALVVFIILAVAVVIVATRNRTPGIVQAPAVTPAAAIAPTAAAMTPLIAVGVPAQHDTNTQDIGTVLHVWLNENERLAVAKVWPTSAPIPAGIDPACYYAKKYSEIIGKVISCAEVNGAISDMQGLYEQEGDQ